MKKTGFLLVALILGAVLIGCGSAGAGGDVEIAKFTRVSIPVPGYMEEVVNSAWSIIPVGSKALITSEAREFCTTPSSFYWFWEDGTIEEYEAKPEQWAVVYQLARATVELYTREGKQFDFIGIPPYVPEYTPANPMPVPPLFTFYILDRDNAIYEELFISEALAAPMTQEEYYFYVVAHFIAYHVSGAESAAPEGSPYRWIGGGTKIIEPPPIEEPPAEDPPQDEPPPEEEPPV